MKCIVLFLISLILFSVNSKLSYMKANLRESSEKNNQVINKFDGPVVFGNPVTQPYDPKKVQPIPSIPPKDIKVSPSQEELKVTGSLVINLPPAEKTTKVYEEN